MEKEKNFNGSYKGEYAANIAYPLGGIGSGNFCVDGCGGITNVSIYHHPNLKKSLDNCFAALNVKSDEKGDARVLQGRAPMMSKWQTIRVSDGLPQFRESLFTDKFPFAEIELLDEKMPLKCSIKAFSPFIPLEHEDSSLPAAAFEYSFKNTTDETQECIFYFNMPNFLNSPAQKYVRGLEDGFVLCAESDEPPYNEAYFSVCCDDPGLVKNLDVQKANWFDMREKLWESVEDGELLDNPPPNTEGEGASPAGVLQVPFSLAPNAGKEIRVRFAWYVPKSTLRTGWTDVMGGHQGVIRGGEGNAGSVGDEYEEDRFYKPYYAQRFSSVDELSKYWRENYSRLKEETLRFSDALHDTNLPSEIMEAVKSNLSILRSPTILREREGRVWMWEGVTDEKGSCHGSCTHVWNYNQAFAALFPAFERNLREVEFDFMQDEAGHQNFRAWLPIAPNDHEWHACADGQFGGIMKVYRQWRAEGDEHWLRSYRDKIKKSLDYGINEWDPQGSGLLQRPHHNTYDIEFWGEDPMCSAFYLAALLAMCEMEEYLGEECSMYEALFERGVKRFEQELFNGEYFVQKIDKNADKIGTALYDLKPNSGDIPKYQFGKAVLAEQLVGLWLAEQCGIKSFIDKEKVKSAIKSVYEYNFIEEMGEYPNPRRPQYALYDESGLVLAAWKDKEDKLDFPFVYSSEVWTGVEYHVADTLIRSGFIDEGLNIVRACRKRYDGRYRNPFAEEEAGYWYGRALSSYALLNSFSAARYDAMSKTLYVSPVVSSNIRHFISTPTGYGVLHIKDGIAKLDVRSGEIEVEHIIYDC